MLNKINNPANQLRWVILLLAIAVLFAIVLVYTANLFLTLEERTNALHVHTHSSY